MPYRLSGRFQARKVVKVFLLEAIMTWENMLQAIVVIIGWEFGKWLWPFLGRHIKIKWVKSETK
jgi:hypothetical protein